MTPQEHSRFPEPGQMTAAMKAAPRTAGAARLRIAIVRGGAVVEERTIERRADVTVGPTEQSAFVIPARDLAESHVLFEASGGTYYLCCPPLARVRIATAGGVTEPDPGARIPLDEASRGRLVLGETTVLFQIVRARPAAAAAALPASLKGGLADDIDWPTTLIAAFSFLLHFGAVGSLWSDWMDPVVDEEVRVADLVESMRALPAPPRIELEQEAPSAPSAAAQNPAAEKATRTGGVARGAPGRGAGGAQGGRMGDAAASALASELRQLGLEMTAALNGKGDATDAVLRDGDVSMGLLDQAAASAAGAGRGEVAGLSFGQGQGGVVRPGAVRGGGLVGNVERGAPQSAGSSMAVRKPVGNAAVNPPTVTGGVVPNAGGTVAGLRGGFTACYRRALDVDPTMQGSARITAKIGPNGEVLSAVPSAVVGLSQGLVSCVAGRVAGARFEPPEGGFAILVIPVSFIHQ